MLGNGSVISQKVKQFVLVFSLFTTLTVILTYPAIFRLTTHFMGVPERFDNMLKFCMAIMGGFGVLKLFHTYSPTSVDPMTNGINMVIKPAEENKGNRETPHRLHIVVAVIGILICIEYLALPFKTTQVDVPQFYKELAKDTDKHTLIDIPLNTRTLYFATIHEKPIVGVMFPGLRGAP